MTIEARLESLERSVNILNDTIKDLISLYLDTQQNPILGDLPKTAGFEPKVIKEKRALKKKKGGGYSMLELRELTDQVLEKRGVLFTTGILGRYNIRSLAELSTEFYDDLAKELTEELNHEYPTSP